MESQAVFQAKKISMELPPSALGTLKLTAFGTSSHPSDRICVCDDNAVAKPRNKDTGELECP